MKQIQFMTPGINELPLTTLGLIANKFDQAVTDMPEMTFYVLTVEGVTYWAIENELGSYTLMLPSEY